MKIFAANNNCDNKLSEKELRKFVSSLLVRRGAKVSYEPREYAKAAAVLSRQRIKNENAKAAQSGSRFSVTIIMELAFHKVYILRYCIRAYRSLQTFFPAAFPKMQFPQKAFSFGRSLAVSRMFDRIKKFPALVSLQTVLESSHRDPAHGPVGDDDFELWDHSQMLRNQQRYKWNHNGVVCKPSCIPIVFILVLIILVVLLPLLDSQNDKFGRINSTLVGWHCSDDCR